MKRRQYIGAIGAIGAGVLAGCTGNDSSDDTGGGSETPEENEGTEHEALAVIDSYIEAVNEKNLDRLAETMHSRHPFNPDNIDDTEMENVSFGVNDVDSYERAVVNEEFSTDDIREMPTIGRWFEEMDSALDEVLDGEKAVLAEVSYETTENGRTVTKTETLTLLTEDGDWTVFFPYEKPVDVPQEAPVDDERYDVVDGIEFDEEKEMATVRVSNLDTIEAEELVVYSTSLDDSSKAWSEESDTLPDLNYLVSPFDPEGDEIVVTIRFEDREIVVHREMYPQEADEALAVLNSYIEAANNEDLDALADAMHSHHPFNPDNLSESEMEDISFDSGYDGYDDPEIVDEEFSTDDVREMESIDFWFAEMDVTLDEVLDGEEAVLAEISYEDTEKNTTVEKTEQIVLLTDDGDWRVFLTYDERVEIPEGEPTDDEQYHVVDSVEFDTETGRATVNYSLAEKIEAQELAVCSESRGECNSVWSPESDALPSAASVSIRFDPEGDEIVVTIRFEDREIVIHRETYEPDADT